MRKRGLASRETVEAKETRAGEARRRAWGELRPALRDAKGVPAAVSEEMRHHARRMARLLRILVVAEEKGDAKATERVKRLIAREQERHDRKIERLLADAGKKGAGSPGAPGAQSPAAPPTDAPGREAKP
jgi:hypothetical protein